VRRFAFAWPLAALSLAAVLVATTKERGVDGEVARSRAEPKPQFRGLTMANLQELADGASQHHEFYFTRAVYSNGMGGYGFRGRGSWSTDYPKADQQFLSVLNRLARNIDAFEEEHPVRLDDPDLRRFPYLYAVEVGKMGLTDPEIQGLRSYLLAGGFLFVDDFWGLYEWGNFVANISRVLPEYKIVDMKLDHALFHSYYDIQKFLQVPNVSNGCAGGPYYESYDDTEPRIRGIFDEKGRLLVLISYNSDLGDAWEHMELSCYPLDRSTFAYEFAVNTIIYAMSH
jgi:hypothetical protein